MHYSIKEQSKRIGSDLFLNSFIDIPRFQALCKECPNYGKAWCCPPFEFDILSKLSAYSSVLIKCVQIEFDGERSYSEMLALMRQQKELLEAELSELERQNVGSEALFAGKCTLCENCSRLDGTECRHPDQRRMSIEALGGDVTGLLRELFSIELEWKTEQKLPNQLVLVGGVLLRGARN